MCIVIFSYKKTPRYNLVLAANRDEFYARPTGPLSFWGKGNRILAGKDLEAGGTWLGAAEGGRFAVLTNFREVLPEGKKLRSRGEVVRSFLESPESLDQIQKRLAGMKMEYPGFNLLFGDRSEIRYITNRSKQTFALEPGVYGLSNHLLDTDWPKVYRGKMLFREAIAGGGVQPEKLFQLLEDSWQPTDELLPDTGLGREWERILAPIYIRSRNYGTRSSAILLIDEKGGIEFTERSYVYDNLGRRATEEKCYRLN